MRGEGATVPSAQALLVVYADVVDSGASELPVDCEGRVALEACTGILLEVVNKAEARVSRRSAGGVVATFNRPRDGLCAAVELRGALAEATQDGRLAGDGLGVRVGIHYGPTMDDGKSVFGEGPLIAAAVNRLASPGQGLCTEDAVLALPQDLSWNAQAVPHLEVAALSGAIPLYELTGGDTHQDWSGGTAANESEASPAPDFDRLELLHGGRCYVCDGARPELTLGRTSTNDVVVNSDLTSRHHARIERRRGRFVIEDSSANGTLIITNRGDSFQLRREEFPLTDSGLICLGGTADKNPDGLLRFQCMG